MKKPIVGIIMGSDSDLPVMKDAADILKQAGILRNGLSKQSELKSIANLNRLKNSLTTRWIV